jgi:hypothetical protein
MWRSVAYDGLGMRAAAASSLVPVGASPSVKERAGESSPSCSLFVFAVRFLVLVLNGG